jgi:hypothetical protein
LAEPLGNSFKLLGLVFDMSLDMCDAVAELVRDSGWKLRNFVRTKRYYSDSDLIMLYKENVLSYLEFRTPAIYHARRKELSKLDNVQTRFPRDAGVDEVTALMNSNLAPLRTRRDIAMLGVLHRAALGEGPPQLQKLLRRQLGSLMLEDPYNGCTRHPLIERSAWGLVPVYNNLGSGAHSIVAVKDFQKYLQERIKIMIREGCADNEWASSYSPR